MNGGSVVEIDLGGAFMEDSFGDPFFGTTTRYEAVPFYFYPSDSCSRGINTQDY
jgi:hypothetical protein